MLLNAVLFAVVMTFPANFSYLSFAAVLLLMGVAGGLFASPNTSSIMNSVPAPPWGGFRDASDIQQRRNAPVDGAVLHAPSPRARCQCPGRCTRGS